MNRFIRWNVLRWKKYLEMEEIASKWNVLWEAMKVRGNVFWDKKKELAFYNLEYTPIYKTFLHFPYKSPWHETTTQDLILKNKTWYYNQEKTTGWCQGFCTSPWQDDMTTQDAKVSFHSQFSNQRDQTQVRDKMTRWRKSVTTWLHKMPSLSPLPILHSDLKHKVKH